MIRLGVPSKGRLMEKTFDWFRARGVELSLAGSDREYAGSVEGVDGVDVEVALVDSPDDVVAEGVLDVVERVADLLAVRVDLTARQEVGGHGMAIRQAEVEREHPDPVLVGVLVREPRAFQEVVGAPGDLPQMDPGRLLRSARSTTL